MRARGIALLGVTILPWVVAAAAPLERDLGGGLVYVRVRELPADLPANPPAPAPACVLDLRYVPADRNAATAFSAWLKFRATVRSPVFVLANRETGAELRRTLHEPHRGTGIAVIGIAGPDFEPDVVVRSTTDNERIAYAILEKDGSVAALLTDLPDKIRNDEARLARPPPPPFEDDVPVAAKAAAPVIDATLQRAVHLHRTLAALRRS